MSGLRESDTAAACNKNTAHTDLEGMRKKNLSAKRQDRSDDHR